MPGLLDSMPAQQPGLLNSPMPMGGQQDNDPSWLRSDGSKKGKGFFGMLPFHDGRQSSEISIGVNINGKEVEIPSLVPTLSKDEIDHLLRGGEPTDEIVRKAADYATKRINAGLPVFAQDGEQGPLPEAGQQNTMQPQ